jgi:hypothetical protein
MWHLPTHFKETTKASRWIAYTTFHPDQPRQIIDTSSRAQARRLSKGKWNSTSPPKNSTSTTTSNGKFTTPRRRNAKPPYTV